jgi:two-component system, LytTR family, response regulator
MNCIVIDDEPLAREGMKMLIAQLPGLNLAGSYSSVIEAGEHLSSTNIDLIFLDIQMPLLSGMEYLRQERPSAKVIITTAYPQFAVDAFELEVADYLVKPIRFERFYKAVTRVSGTRKEPVMTDTDEDYVFIRTERKYVRTRYAEIDYVEGLKDYVMIYCGDEKHAVASNLKTVHDSLPSSLFLRINKSYVINMSRVKAVENDSVLVGAKRIPIGENYRKAVVDFVNMKKVIRRQ